MKVIFAEFSTIFFYNSLYSISVSSDCTWQKTGWFFSLKCELQKNNSDTVSQFTFDSCTRSLKITIFSQDSSLLFFQHVITLIRNKTIKGNSLHFASKVSSLNCQLGRTKGGLTKNIFTSNSGKKPNDLLLQNRAKGRTFKQGKFWTLRVFFRYFTTLQYIC